MCHYHSYISWYFTFQFYRSTFRTLTPTQLQIILTTFYSEISKLFLKELFEFSHVHDYTMILSHVTLTLYSQRSLHQLLILIHLYIQVSVTEQSHQSSCITLNKLLQCAWGVLVPLKFIVIITITWWCEMSLAVLNRYGVIIVRFWL